MRPAFSGKPASFALRIAGGDSIMQGQTASGPSYEYLHFISFECSFGFAMTVVSHEGWRRIVTLLPDREPATAGTWFAARPRFRSSPVTVVADMAKPWQRPCRTRYRSQIVGI
jgi:hypothetical protein